MVTIAIELNHVIRNINKQLLKYYQKDYHPELDTDDIDEKKENVLKKYINFDSHRELNQFIYIDYPFEIFGAAKAMDKNLARDVTNWMEEMTNREDEEFRVIYYSLNEEALTIQSSYFFLSKLGTRVREVVFPKSIDEMKDKCDVIISSDEKSIQWAKDNNKQSVKIETNYKDDTSDKERTTVADFDYDSMEDVINDTKFLDKLVDNFLKNKEV
jgi:hypothetical protein